MQGYKRILAAAMACLGVSAVSPAQATSWVKAESKHFTLYSPNSPKTAEAYLVRLEQYYLVLSKFYSVTPEDEATMPRLPVYLLGGRMQFRAMWPTVNDGTAGVLTGCTEGQGAAALFEDDVVRQTHDALSQDENTTQTFLFHEYAHNFMFMHASGAYPPWFVEGFAEFYSTTKIQDNQAVIGMAFSMRARQLLSPYATPVSYEDLLRDTWRRPNGDNATREDAFYAQSWLLTHWIMSDHDRHDRFNAFVDRYRKGEDAVAAFEAAFGMPVKALDRTLYDYLDHIKAGVYSFEGLIPPKVTVTAMPRSADKLLLWDAGDRLCLYHGDMRPRLLDQIRTEAAKNPDDEFAADVLARAETIVGDETKAIPSTRPGSPPIPTMPKPISASAKPGSCRRYTVVCWTDKPPKAR